MVILMVKLVVILMIIPPHVPLNALEVRKYPSTQTVHTVLLLHVLQLVPQATIRKCAAVVNTVHDRQKEKEVEW